MAAHIAVLECLMTLVSRGWHDDDALFVLLASFVREFGTCFVVRPPFIR